MSDSDSELSSERAAANSARITGSEVARQISAASKAEIASENAAAKSELKQENDAANSARVAGSETAGQINQQSAAEIKRENDDAASARTDGADTSAQIDKSAKAELSQERTDAEAARTAGVETAGQIKGDADAERAGEAKSAKDEINQERGDAEAARMSGSGTAGQIKADTDAERAGEAKSAKDEIARERADAETARLGGVTTVTQSSQGQVTHTTVVSTPIGGGIRGRSIMKDAFTGGRIPLFDPSQLRPSPWKAEDLNEIVNALNGFLGMNVVRLSSVSLDGTVQPPMGEFNTQGQPFFLTLYDPSAGSSPGAVVPMTVVSEQDNYLTCTNSVGATVYVAKPPFLQRAKYDGKTITLFDGSHTGQTHLNSE